MSVELPPLGARPALPLIAPVPDGMPGVTGQCALRIGQDTLTVAVTVPAAPVPLAAVLPVFHGLSNALVELAELREAADGRTISCRAGCGACCRQAVPIAPSEARRLAALVEAMPAARQTIVRERFRAAVTRLAEAGVDTRTDAAAHSPDAAEAFGRVYRAQQIACPFLEAESCSIHPDRPAACREYIVTTPASRCGAAELGGVRSVPLSGHLSLAILAVDRDLENRGAVLLVDALDWAAAHPDPPQRPAPGLVEAVFARLSEQLAAAFALAAEYRARHAAGGEGAGPDAAVAAQRPA